MKKLIYCALVLAAGLFASSCQQENLEPVAKGNTVTYTVTVPDLTTKSTGEGVNVNELVYQVWRTSTANDLTLVASAEDAREPKTELLYSKTAEVRGGVANLQVDLVNDQNYTILFWAQVENGGYYNTGDLRNVTLTTKPLGAFDDDRAAFSGVDCIVAGKQKANQTVSLTRPFGQLNLGTVERDADKMGYTLSVEASSVTVYGASTKFNVATGVASNLEEDCADLTFASNAPFMTDVEKLNGTYEWIAMDYIFVPANQATLNVDYTITTNHGNISNSISNIPTQKNYRTNIIGNLLTSKTDYVVELKQGWAGDDKNIEVIFEGLVKNVNNDYEVTNELGLAYAIDNLFALGGDFYLTAALYDMTDYDVNPPSVPEGITLNIYGEAPVVSRASSDVTAVTGVRIIGLDNLLDVVAGSASISGVTLEDEGAVLVNDATEGTLIVANCEADTILPEGKGEILKADEVGTLKTLQDALDSGVKEIIIKDPIVIAAGETVTIDLKGKTVRAIDNTEKNFELIKNQGNLVIKNTAEETAMMTVKANINSGWNRYSAVIANTVGGNLTIEGDIILEHLGGTDMAYGIDNLTNGKGTSAVTTINGATVKSPYRAVRQFLNGVEATNTLTVKSGSKLFGENKAIFFHDPSEKANSGTLIVDEGAELYGDVYLFVTAGSTDWPVAVSIASSALMNESEVISGNVPATHSVVEENGYWTVKTNEATVGDVKYISLVEAVANAKAGETITLLSNVILNETLTLPADITLNGNGKHINGTVNAGGNLTFVGHTKITSFSASYYNRVITIDEGACLEITGGGRVTLGYGNTFNITGSLENAKTADKSEVQPSLIIPGGISITGSYTNPTTMNVDNAYVQIGNTSSKNSAASGEFNMNFNNSIAEFTNQFTFAEPTNGKTPTFNLNVTNSVLTTATKLVAAAPGCNVTVDNSVVTLGTYFRNSGKFDVVNGSVLTGATIQFGENGGNDGALTVDASTVTITASSKGHALDGKGKGSITLQNAAVATIDYVKDMILAIGDDCTFNYTSKENCSNHIPVAEGLAKDENGAYHVSSAAGLKKMNEMFKDQSAGINAVMNLVADIDFKDYTWTTVDSHADTRFWISEINGNGHTISNLTINGQAMFSRFAGSGNVTIKDITFDKATVNSNGDINTSILTVQTYQNVLLDNVDVKNSSISGGYKVAPLIATVYNESLSSITTTLKNCDVEDVTVTATQYDFCTTGMVAFVNAGDNDAIKFENCTVTNVDIYAPNDTYKAHAAIYTTGSSSLYNEADGVIVNNVNFYTNN